MDLDQQIAYLLSGSEFADNLSDVQGTINQLKLSPSYPIILVGGTNGKGSTCAYLTTILTLAGYRVGTFTSPHIFSYNERISINNQAISDSDLSLNLGLVINASKNNLGLFKTFTLAAHQYFIKNQIDIAVIEVGIGGLHDATNLFEPTISAITTIDYDHCKMLGNTLEEIGLQKSGIFRTNKPAFIAMKTPPQSVIEYAKTINAQLNIIGSNFGYSKHERSFDVWSEHENYFGLPIPALRGLEQLDNAALAVAILSKLKNKFPVALAFIKTGLLQTRLLGRLSILPGLPQIIIDVAHNPQAVSRMLQNMIKLPFAKHNYAVFGIANDKDITAIINLCKDNFAKWFIAPIKSKRSISNNKLMEIMQNCKIEKDKIIACKSIEIALNTAKSISTNDDKIVCFGSFLVVEEAYKCN